MSQNIFDDPVFFEGYYQLRQGLNYKDLFEQPAMRRLLPDVAGKRVLDIGCGYGHNCLEFAQKGAQRVLGIDLSEKMLAVARSESAHPNIEYRRMDMADLSQLNPGYDLIYSSLAFHYAADFGALAADIVRLLNPGGQLLYSQEHPIVTASIDCKAITTATNRAAQSLIPFLTMRAAGGASAHGLSTGSSIITAPWARF